MHDSITDVPGIRVGHWTDAEAATGCTVVLCPPEGAVAAVAVLGGAPGTRETDALAPANLVERAHAVLLTGGSAYGLNAAAGVMRWLEERGVGYKLRHAIVPIVPAAVLYDLGIGRADVRPDAEAGYAACEAAAELVEQGSIGAGAGATVAKFMGPGHAIKAGLGTAAEQTADGAIVAAIVAVNAIGEVVEPESGAILAGIVDDLGVRTDPVEHLRLRVSEPPVVVENTTIAVVATDIALTRGQAQRVALMAHAGIARTIRPSHTPADGDTVFALSTGTRVQVPVDLVAIGALAARALQRAIVRAVQTATPLAGVAAYGGQVEVRPLNEEERGWVEDAITAWWGAPVVVSRGNMHRPSLLDGFVANAAGRRAGLITLHLAGDACEVVSLNAIGQGRGAGTALLQAAQRYARAHGCRRLWLITTNDNLRALRFYQRRGMRIVAVHRGAVNAARRDKPAIPRTGEHGIPLHDEIELEMDLTDGDVMSDTGTMPPVRHSEA